MSPFDFPEIPKEETDKLKRTIQLLSKILAELKIEYRIFGSIIITAVLGRPQRKLGDIDLMINSKDKERLLQKLREEDYRVKERKFRFLGLDFTWVEAASDRLNELTIFSGRFDRDKNFIVKLSKNLSAVARSEAIKPTAYNFYQANFVGIPTKTAYYGTWASRRNPKRKFDLAVFEVKKIKRPPKDYSAIDFYYKYIRLPLLYRFSCFLQNILGRISVFLGGNYDFWRP